VSSGRQQVASVASVGRAAVSWPCRRKTGNPLGFVSQVVKVPALALPACRDDTRPDTC
jgi:hypothetical protein